MARKTIASREYSNGRFGDNTASLSRVTSEFASIQNGYSVSEGSRDPFFYTSPVAAKAAYRSLLASKGV